MAGLRHLGIRAVLVGAGLICAVGSARAQWADDDPAGALDARDAPYVQGTVALRMPKTLDITVGFVGKGADGREYSNRTGMAFDHGVHGPISVTSETHAPQLTTLFVTSKNEVRFRHVKLAPGEYLFYVRLGEPLGRKTMFGPMAAWQQATVKAGDQLTLDLKVDETRMGSLIVTLPDEEVQEVQEDEEVLPLALIPIPLTFTCSRFREMIYFRVANPEKGQKIVVVKNVPAGKYRASCITSSALVEVIAGKETAVTLVRGKSGQEQ